MRDRLLVLAMEADRLSAIDPHSGVTLRTVDTDFNPHEVVVTPDGAKTYVTCASGNVVTVIDNDSFGVIERITHDTFDFPHGWAVGDQYLYLAGTRSERIYLVDWRADEIVDHFGTGQELSHMIAVTNDESTGYVANIGSDTVAIVDLDARRVVDSIPVGAGPEGIGLHPSEEYLYVANQDDDDLWVIDLDPSGEADYETVVKLPLDETPVRVVWTPDGETALVANREAGTVSFVDHRHERGDRTVPWETKRIRVGLWAGGIAVDPDGHRAYVANNKTNDISVIDLDARAELRRIDTDLHPDGIAYLEG